MRTIKKFFLNSHEIIFLPFKIFILCFGKNCFNLTIEMQGAVTKLWFSILRIHLGPWIQRYKMKAFSALKLVKTWGSCSIADILLMRANLWGLGSNLIFFVFYFLKMFWNQIGENFIDLDPDSLNFEDLDSINPDPLPCFTLLL